MLDFKSYIVILYLLCSLLTSSDGECGIFMKAFKERVVCRFNVNILKNSSLALGDSKVLVYAEQISTF